MFDGGTSALPEALLAGCAYALLEGPIPGGTCTTLKSPAPFVKTVLVEALVPGGTSGLPDALLSGCASALLEPLLLGGTYAPPESLLGGTYAP